MTTLDPERLERLADEFDDPTSAEWAVYGDELSGMGDARGELIAIEQRLAQTRDEAARKQLDIELASVYERLEPSLVPASILQYGAGRSCEHTTYIPCHGYIEAVYHFPSEAEAGQLEVVLSCEGARFVRLLDVSGRARQMPRIAAAIAAGSGHLRALSLDLESSWDDPEPDPSLGSKLGAALTPKLTRLRTLSLRGAGLVADLRLPAVEELSLTGFDAIADFDAMDLPRLRSLELRLQSFAHSSSARPSAAWLARVLSGAKLPALRRLDLRHNGRAALRGRHYFGGPAAPELFDALLDAPILDQLDELVLPPPPSAEHVARMLEAPRLRGLERVVIPLTTYAIDVDAMQRAGVAVELGVFFPHPGAMDIEHGETLRTQLGSGQWVELRPMWLGHEVAGNYGQLSPPARATLGRMLDACVELRRVVPDVERPEPSFVVEHGELVAALGELRDSSGEWPHSLREWAPVVERDELPGAALAFVYDNPLLRGL